MEVAGVDCCKGRWLLVRADAAGQLRIEDVSIISTFRELIAATAECAAGGTSVGLARAPDGDRVLSAEIR